MARLTHTFSALDPLSNLDVKVREIGLEASQINAMVRQDGKLSDSVRLTRLRLAQEVAESPDVVFQDWKRPEHEEGLCYCGRPTVDFRGIGKQTPPPPGMVFRVYVTPSGKIADWRWEPADIEFPEYPENWRERFGKIVWPHVRPI